MKLENYRTFVFDCDGVILNSNKVKTDAFYQAALPFGEDAAKQLVKHHVANGGISRYKKFEWFIREIVPSAEADINTLLSSYANFVRDGLLTCDIAEGLEELREKTAQANWLIVSGGDQSELREIFALRGLTKLFDGGIFGSPDSKDTILEREIASANIRKEAIFIGDSRYDHIASSNAGLDFVFLSKWSEFTDWKQYCEVNDISVLSAVSSLV